MKIQSASFILAAALVTALSGCTVDKNYSLEKDGDLDTRMTLFQNGLAVPIIKNTDSIKVGDLIKSIEDSATREIFKLDSNGKYDLRVNGHAQMDSIIENIKFTDLLKLEPVNIDNPFSIKFGDLDPSKFKSDSVNFGEGASLADLSSLDTITIPSIKESVKMEAGIKGQDFGITMKVDPIKDNQVVFTKGFLEEKAGLSPIEDVPLPDSTVNLSIQPKTISAFNIPDKVKKINSVTLNKNARLSVKLEIANSVLKEGTITPEVKVDLSDLLFFEGGSGVLDLKKMTLTQDNDFSNTQEFAITGVNIDKIGTSKSIKTTGSVKSSGIVAVKSKCTSVTGDLGIKITLTFLDFEVESVNCEIKEFVSRKEDKVAFKINEIKLPRMVDSVDSVYFTEDSKMTVSLSANNLDQVPGLSVIADTIRIKFPEEFTVSGENVSDNVLTLTAVNLAAGKTSDVRISGTKLPKPVEKKINFSKQIDVYAKCTATGSSINSSDLKKLTEDISAVASVNASLKLADFKANIEKYEAEITETKGSVSFEVPEEAAAYGTFTILPKGSPAITVNFPDLGRLALYTDGIKIKAPSFMRLGTISDPDIQCEGDTVIVISKLAGKTYVVPIEKLVAKAEKLEGKYQVKGNYAVSGKVYSYPLVINMAEARKISNKKVFAANVPPIIAEKLLVDSISFNVNESRAFVALKGDDIPEMLVSATDVDLDDVKATLSLDTKGLPSVGATSKYMMDLSVILPSFVKPSVLNVKGEIKNNVTFSKEESITGLDLSKCDFQEIRKLGLKDSVRITGRIYATNPEIELSTVKGTVEGSFKAKIAGPDSKISVEKVTARIDYAVDTLMYIPFQDFSKLFGDVNFKLPDLSAVIGVRSNLALPMNASASLVPMKDGNVLENKAVKLEDLKFPYSENPEQTDSVTNSRKLNFGELLDTKPDSLKFAITLRTKKDEDSKIQPKAKYTLGLGYNIGMPLKVEDGFKVEIHDTLDLNGSLSGLESILATTTFGMKGDIESALPVGATVTLEFLSFNKEKGTYTKLPFKEVKTDLLEPNSTTSFEIVTGPENPGESVSEITHLRFSIVLDSDGKRVSPDSYLKISNITLILPEGLNIEEK